MPESQEQEGSESAGTQEQTDFAGQIKALQAELEKANEQRDRFAQQRDEARTELNSLKVGNAYKDYALAQYDPQAADKIDWLKGLEIDDKGNVKGDVKVPPGMSFKSLPSAGPSKSAETNKPPEPNPIDAAAAYRKEHGLSEMRI